jgi:hypothetical protein
MQLSPSVEVYLNVDQASFFQRKTWKKLQAFISEKTDPHSDLRGKISEVPAGGRRHAFVLLLEIVLYAWNHGGKLPGDWRKLTFQSHISYVARAAESIVGTIPDPESHRWISEYKTDSGGYPQAKLTRLVPSFIKGQGIRLRSKGDVGITVCLHRYIANMLQFMGNLQAAHRCKQKRCFNPHHLKFVSDLENKDDHGCRYGCAHYCPHKPKCIWTDEEGRPYPCRNDPNEAWSKDECAHEKSCFK